MFTKPSKNGFAANSSVPFDRRSVLHDADPCKGFAVATAPADARQPRSAFTDAFGSAVDELLVETAATPEQILEVQRLRYRVDCEERGFLECSADGLERDCFDVHSRHVLVRSRFTGAMLGTVRVVLPTIGGAASLPMSGVCEDHVLSSILDTRAGEISRFALARDRPGVSPAAAALMRLCLMRGIVDISGRVGLTHWCAIMENSLLRLLRATAIYFEAIGPAVEFHGRGQPVVGAINTILGRIRGERPDVWGYITGQGTLWSEACI